MYDDDDAAKKFAISCAPLIMWLITECARSRVNKREQAEVSIYAETIYIL